VETQEKVEIYFTGGEIRKPMTEALVQISSYMANIMFTG
jgi:hypothetical protein